MPISVADLAKKLEIAPEAVVLHAMDLGFEIPEDEMIPDDIAREIERLETGDEIAQLDHEFEEQLDREIVEKQAQQTAGHKKKKKKKKEKVKKEKAPETVTPSKPKDGVIELPETLTVRQLAAKIGKPIPLVLIKLKENGIVANIKEELEYEVAAIVAEELGVKVKKEAVQLSGEALFRGSLEELLKEEDPEYLQPRPPVVSIMGHVDHGKTSILDYIRKSHVAEQEAGGITQKIGAYQVEHKGDIITFLDTPGHEAFTTMRARGARATDIAILVVAATEGLKPQSIEAINHAREAGIPIIVAINKMDLPGANPDLVKGQLAEQNLTPEDWGGDTICVEVSAKTGQGIEKLLESIKIVAELQDLKANPDRPAIGTVIEATLDKKTGISATILINTGTLKKGDAFVLYDQYGKVRIMKDYKGDLITQAPPSTPVQIFGFKTLPRAGDLLQVVENEKVARRKAEEVAAIKEEDEKKRRKKFSLAALKAKIAEGKMDQLKLIVKADSKGALEAVTQEVEKLKGENTIVKVIHGGVGEITESDIMLASSGGAIVVGFNTKAAGRIKKLAEREGITILHYDVIYHLSEKIQEMLSAKEQAEEGEKIFGSLRVKKIFAYNKRMVVLGGEIIEGEVRRKAMVRVYRDKSRLSEKDTYEEASPDSDEVLIGTAKVESLQRGSDPVDVLSEVGLECGLKLSHKGLTFQEKDRLEFFSA